MASEHPRRGSGHPGPVLIEGTVSAQEGVTTFITDPGSRGAGDAGSRGHGGGVIPAASTPRLPDSVWAGCRPGRSHDNELSLRSSRLPLHTGDPPHILKQEFGLLLQVIWFCFACLQRMASSWACGPLQHGASTVWMPISSWPQSSSQREKGHCEARRGRGTQPGSSDHCGLGG